MIHKSEFLKKIKKGIGIVTRPARLTSAETKEFNKIVARPQQIKLRKGVTRDRRSAMNDTIMKFIINKRKKNKKNK